MQVADTRAGTPRIGLVFGIALVNYLSHALIRYSTPLYFSALEYPRDAYETFSFYWLVAFIAGSTLSGLLASRFDERNVWSAGVAGFAGLGLLLIAIPGYWVVPFAGLLYGITAAAQWVGAMALVQTAESGRRGRANALLMIALGGGSFLGAPLGAALLNWTSGGEPVPGDFLPLLWFHTVICIGAAVLIRAVARHPGPVHRERVEENWRTNFSLLRMPRYLAMVIPLSLMGGPVFQTVNIYLPYRAEAEEIALKVGAVDQGWSMLLTAGYGMQFLGGLFIIVIAGKKAGPLMAAAVLGGYAACSLGIGLSNHVYGVVVFTALFEFLRQLMRWSQTGYITEHMPIELRGPAIGFSTTLSGLASTLFATVMRNLQSPDSPEFSSSLPFFVGGSIGLAGAVLLLIAHHTVLKTREVHR
jgi:MFS family permease